MKRKIRKMIAVLMSLSLVIMGILPDTPVLAAQTIYNNDTGTHGGYNYELWKDYGNTSMTLNDGGTFSCQWSNIGNALFRKGIKFNSDKTYQQLGNITVDYGCQYNPSGNSYLCVYGWTRNPLVEYYIVDSWGNWRPPGATSKGTITVDGGTYDVYETTRVNQPSIDGNTTFQQYWSVRTSKRTSGTISVSEHFKQWERMGMRMGNMYEVALTVEGYQSSGSANVYKNDIRIGENPTPTSSPGPSTRDAFSTIEAEQYNSTNSSTIQEIGTANNGRGIGYIENGNTVTYSNIDFGNGATKFSATVATENNTSIQIRSGSANGTLLGTLSVDSTGSWNTYKTISTDISKITGVHDIVLVFSGPVNVDNFIFSGNSAEPSPGTDTRNAYSNIQAEDYDSSYGSNLQTFGLSDGGRAIGYIENGYSTTYKNVNFSNGLASVTARVATQNATTIQVRSGGANGTILGTISVPSTNSWDSYQNVTADLSNITGVHDITLVYSGAVNVDYFVFKAADEQPEPSPGTDTRNAYSNIQAEDYDSSYGSNLQTFSLSDGGRAIGYIENGYFTTYKNIDFGSGAVSVTARVATQMSNTTIQIRLGSASGTLLGTISVPSTGSFDTYQNVSANISKTTGVNDIVLVFSGPVNVDSFVFSKSGSGSGDLTGKKLVALTFDDGPNTTTTPQVLDILEREGVVATFFLIGSNINDNVKPVMQRQVSLGCELANHSWSHSDMSSMSYNQIQQEITNTNNKIYQMVGVTPKFFRPPYISTSNTMYQAIDLPFICGITCNDWESSTSASQRASTVLNSVQDGDIVLLHDFDGNYNTVQALSTIIQGLKDRGYAFVTVSQLFELKGVNPNVEYKIWSGTNR